jgi:Ca-activated chloride channel homolog
MWRRKNSVSISAVLRRAGATVPFVRCAAELIGFFGLIAGHSLAGAQVPSPAANNNPISGVIRDNVDLVLVNVTVLDRHDRVVNGLSKADFSVFDDGSARSLKYMSNGDDPASVVLVFDSSASMEKMIPGARSAVRQLLEESTAQDEFSVVVVNDRPRVAVEFGDPDVNITEIADAAQAAGKTALWDGVYLGLEQMRHSSRQKKAMIVISDGGDDRSRYTETELKRIVEELDVRLYAIVLRTDYPPPPRARPVGVFDPHAQEFEQQTGAAHLDDLSAVTGGRLFVVSKPAEIARAAAQISREIESEYVLGYYAGADIHNGKWHKLKVQLSREPSGARLRVYAKKGYYAAAQ